MSASNLFETDLIAHILQNKASPNIGDATGLVGSSAAGSFWITLHEGTPDLDAAATGQATGETNYSSYARRAVPRTTGATGWTVSGNTGDNATAITFPTSGGAATETLTMFGLGTAGTVGATGYLALYGTLTSALNASTGIVPQFAAGALDITVD